MAGNTVSKIKIGTSNYDIIASNGVYYFNLTNLADQMTYPNGISYNNLLNAYNNGLKIICKLNLSSDTVIDLPVIAFSESENTFIFGAFADIYYVIFAMPDGLGYQEMGIITEYSELISISEINSICGM